LASLAKRKISELMIALGRSLINTLKNRVDKCLPEEHLKEHGIG